jgi:hypothetical protein
MRDKLTPAFLAVVDAVGPREEAVELGIGLPVFPFRRCVTRHAKRDQIVERVRLQVRLEKLIGSDMVTLKILRLTASCAFVAVAFLSGLPLPIPIRATIIRVATTPRRALVARSIV